MAKKQTAYTGTTGIKIHSHRAFDVNLYRKWRHVFLRVLWLHGFCHFDHFCHCMNLIWLIKFIRQLAICCVIDLLDIVGLQSGPDDTFVSEMVRISSCFWMATFSLERPRYAFHNIIVRYYLFSTSHESHFGWDIWLMYKSTKQLQFQTRLNIYVTRDLTHV